MLWSLLCVLCSISRDQSEDLPGWKIASPQLWRCSRDNSIVGFVLTESNPWNMTCAIPLWAQGQGATGITASLHTLRRHFTIFFQCNCMQDSETSMEKVRLMVRYDWPNPIPASRGKSREGNSNLDAESANHTFLTLRLLISLHPNEKRGWNIVQINCYHDSTTENGINWLVDKHSNKMGHILASIQIRWAMICNFGGGRSWTAGGCI